MITRSTPILKDSRQTILFTDSKGAAIKEVLPEFARGRFTIVNRGGATAIYERLIKELLLEVTMTQSNSGSTSLIAAPLLSVKSIVCLAMFTLLYK
jgi:hypothetical protein